METVVDRGAVLRERAELLTEDDVAAMVDVEVRTAQNWRSGTDGPPYVKVGRSGIPFDAETRLGHRRPYKPSIDRIDSSRGYLRDNVRLVCVAINYALGDWGEAVLVHLAERIVATRKMKSRARTSD